MQLPISIKLESKPCLIIGGGEQALRKARLLAKAKAELHVAIEHSSPALADEFEGLISKSAGRVHRLEQISAEHMRDLISNKALCVIADCTDEACAESLSQLCQSLNIPVNVVDRPRWCSFSFPAIIDRSPINIAVSSGGSAPLLARRIREKIETQVSSRVGALASLAAQYRAQVNQALPKQSDRLRFWEWVFDGPIAERVFAGQIQQARRQLQQALTDDQRSTHGEVFLVGAGPGDPDLLTLRALRLMQLADVVLYDRLVSDAILDLVRRDAERIYVGKQNAEPSTPQTKIHDLLLQHARRGQRVLRLKGGDPFIFGRGGEEIEQLSAAGIDFQIVPGITAALGCASYAGIPLTHRDHAQSVRFVTGHLRDGTLDLPWSEFIEPTQTLVFYMGLSGLALICQQMIAHGRAADTPVAVIQRGTTNEQKTVIGQLSDIADQVALHKIRAPTITIIGKVVELHRKLAWFGHNDQVQ